ncbi:hypothetical protein ACOMHN_016807 [Nucella lapillus]
MSVYLCLIRYTWRTPIADILGEDFQFTSPQLSEQVTLKDVLSHRTGLATTNLPFFAGSPMTRPQFAKRIRYLPAKKLLRDEFEYNNWMYGLAGRVTEVLGGAPWEELLQTQLLRPLNMSDTGVMGKTVWVQDPRFARPYVMLRGEAVPSDPAIYSINPQEPAGAIASSADDMAKWLLLHISKGVSTRGDYVLNDTRLREMMSTQVSLTKDFRDRSDLWKPQFPVTYATDGYGFGWITATYRGYPVTWHSGSIYAYTSYIAFLPHIDVGFFVSTNGPGGSSNVYHVIRQLFYHAADLLLGETPWQSVSNACLFPQLWLNKSSPSQAEASNETVYDDPEFFKPERYAARYSHPLFGDVDVVVNGSRGLAIQYGNLGGRLFRAGEEEEENVAMWQVVGRMEFMFMHGNKSSYQRVNFTRLEGGGDGVFKALVLSDPGVKEYLEFHREGPPGASSRGSRLLGSRDNVGVDVVVMGVSLCLALRLFALR